jgi:hypothetical protein
MTVFLKDISSEANTDPRAAAKVAEEARVVRYI